MHLSTTETPGRLTFSVTDTGDGIPVGQAKEIFKRYKKANNLVQGSGLGLHICCTIARKLGAEIKLDESYKDGARFLMIL
ncbi:sensor histidine kinase [Prevotella sp.]|uniref:sensor histidine kinase n=1 Tax=Prevotella sp. TaxID=59823 RepID=UPI0030777DC9